MATLFDLRVKSSLASTSEALGTIFKSTPNISETMLKGETGGGNCVIRSSIYYEESISHLKTLHGGIKMYLCTFSYPKDENYQKVHVLFFQARVQMLLLLFLKIG